MDPHAEISMRTQQTTLIIKMFREAGSKKGNNQLQRKYLQSIVHVSSNGKNIREVVLSY